MFVNISRVVAILHRAVSLRERGLSRLRENSSSVRQTSHEKLKPRDAVTQRAGGQSPICNYSTRAVGFFVPVFAME
jgi:hypothetical protein